MTARMETRVLAELRAGPMTIDEIAARLGVTYPAVRMAISLLRESGDVASFGVRRQEKPGKLPVVYRAVRS